ncbi:phosphatidylinositol phosphate synthase [uncultured Tessaracoccus sp.]|uniref:phosphatidylinositol phosphate synthase n=1 Tax=uncultured Tessaracoccus sp. TaxID=905023 RepID=UPI0025FEFA9C|nr:CDP-alcohol phosphatidyltransferase family protein [uncultured Tessaracoccus sp.]
MLERLRGLQTRMLGPLGARLTRRGVSPDAITWLGGVGVTLAAILCFPAGRLWQGALAVAALATLDMLDGHVARALPGRDHRYGAFLDASLDRVADAGVLGGLAWHLGLVRGAEWAAGAVVALVAAQCTSYVKARAEAVGATADVGVVTRADRIALACAGAFLAGVGVPWALETVVVVLTVGGVVSVVQRVVAVRHQLRR